ncbi:3-hydroxy acid dehydrogenase / malonic semialdehyde reductase [Candidatus Nanopelagicus hibericus]|uniref:3-hydroxy acid dehydrogenase / malonic semialdehyde reductase n=1 Tax=Candidatus Nanopelagicus hibericus TaxID=1884915 RepID=A0A249K8W3_9ACTN|nr:SDR family oxidoreductase [Candidatus Nanopelagicus hibericus]ASY13165.1 3-hydroxy acid dehydrogenase / malonic semialdehyde reductase [Candidatus Nanopelagicus hibericus]
MSKFAVVTGANKGIGRVTSIALARNGWQVGLLGRDLIGLQSVADEIGDTALPVHCDVSDRKSVSMAFSTIKAKFNRLDLLFNNAGVVIPASPLEEVATEDWKRVFDTNVGGVFYCTQEAFLLMQDQKPQGGRIINNGSISAHVPRPNYAPYTASKHAITGLTRSTSLDGRKYNIACGQIDIGNADTNMASVQRVGALQANGQVMAEPMIDAQIVANAVLHMAALPLEANIQFMTVIATKMPYIGRG